MPHIVESCPLTKLNGGLSRLHSKMRMKELFRSCDQLWFMAHIREEEEEEEDSILSLKANTLLPSHGGLKAEST